MASLLRQPATVVLLVVLAALLVAAGVMVPWNDPAPIPAAARTQALASLPDTLVTRGKEFAAAVRPGSYLALLLNLAVALVLGLTPWGARVIAWCGRALGGHWLAEAVLGGLTVLLVAQLVTLPLSAWHHTVVVRYGLSNQTWAMWAGDVARSYAVTLVLSGVALTAFYTVLHLAPKWWWAWVAAGSGILVVLMSAVYPVLVEPLFNNFHPMPDSPLRTEIIAMADADGVPVTEVLVSDASRRTNAVNAYVSGLGPTRRIVVYDTLLAAPDEQVLSVVAHELGHAKRGDVWIGTSLAALGTAAAVCALALLAQWTGLLRRAGVEDLRSPRSAALVLAFVALVGVLSTPIQNLVSRHIEARADQHALELTRDPVTFARMQAALAAGNLSDVDPPGFVHWFFGSHPSTVERIAMAEEFRR